MQLEFSLEELLGRNNYAASIIHRSVFQLPFPGLIQAAFRREAGSPWTSRHLITEPTYKNRQVFALSFTPKGQLMSRFTYPKNTCLWAVEGSRCTSREHTSTWEKPAVCKICENLFWKWLRGRFTHSIIFIWSSRQDYNLKLTSMITDPKGRHFMSLKSKWRIFFPLKDNSGLCRITHITIHFCLFFHHQSKYWLILCN